MFVRSLLSLCLLTSAACDDGSSTGTPDAPRVDGQTSRVMEVTCPGTTPVAFRTLDTRFEPQNATITVGQIVKFESTLIDHPIGPLIGDPLSDPDLVVQGGRTKCFSFLAAGSFKFRCTAHNYLGTLTVN